MSEAIKVILKPKTISLLVDFCVEEKIEFNVKPQAFPDTDWEFNLLVKDIKTAVTTGMFLRENRIDVGGGDAQAKAKKPAVSKKKDDDKAQVEDAQQPEDAQSGESTEQGLF